jgi:hypothetical protein
MTTSTDHLPGRIAVVIGSTRPTRICPEIAAWFTRIAEDGSALSYELVDLVEVNLPRPTWTTIGSYGTWTPPSAPSKRRREPSTSS